MKEDKIRTLADRYENYYAGRIARDLFMKVNPIPRFEIGADKTAWTGPARDGKSIIHVGLGLFADYPDGTPACSNDSDFHLIMRFLTGHESGHQKYTTDRAFSSAIRNGYFGFVEYAVKEVSGKPMRLLKESDYDAALQYLYEKHHVRISRKAAMEFIHFIVNALEDGRMERCNMLELPGFKSDVIAYRGMTWEHSPISEPPDLNDPRCRLTCTLNQILSLATSGIWQKGFVKYLAGTSVERFVRTLRPEIEAAVTSRSCAKGMRHASNVVMQMYPFLLEACKLTDIEMFMSEFIAKIIASLPDLDPDNRNSHSYAHSDKEDENMEKQGGEGKLPVNIFKSTDSGGKESENADASGNIGNAGGGGNNKSGDQTSEDAPDDSETVKKAMEDAMKAAEIAASSAATTQTAAIVADNNVKQMDDTTLAEDTVGEDVIKQICPGFNEYQHVFSLKEDLPLHIKQECARIHRQYEQYFRQRKKPAAKNQKSGKFDPHQLSRLVRGDLDVYRRPEKDDSFSGSIEIFLDNSGSMSGKKKEAACETLARIEESLKGLIPLKICAFDSTRRTNVEIIKNWNEVSRKNFSWNYMKYGRTGGGTPTATVLQVGREEMIRRTERNKLIVLLTDENSGDNLKKVIRDVRDSGIQLCGIYFEENISVSEKKRFLSLFENRDAIVCKPDEIGAQLIPLIQRFTQKK